MTEVVFIDAVSDVAGIDAHDGAKVATGEFRLADGGSQPKALLICRSCTTL